MARAAEDRKRGEIQSDTNPEENRQGKKARDRFLSPRADLHTQRGCEHSALRVRSQTKKDTVNINLC